MFPSQIIFRLHSKSYTALWYDWFSPQQKKTAALWDDEGREQYNPYSSIILDFK